MKIINDIFKFYSDSPTVVSVGKFDGVHKGHKLLCERMKPFADEGMVRCMVTFDVPPSNRIEHTEKKVIISEEERELLLEKSGMDIICILNFSDKIRKMSPEDFINLLSEHLCMKAMVVGSDFKFGYKGSGNTKLLTELSEKNGFSLQIVEKLKSQNKDISSTLIRELISTGDIEEANSLLGYDYYVYGKIVHGNRIGHTIGVPTINIVPPPEKLLPPNGVYVSKVIIKGRTYHAVTDVGTKPTVSDNGSIIVESHILDYSENIYEENARVCFLKFLRPEKKFDDVKALGNQIKSDIKQTLAYFSK
ncbi:MAG: bifunctional riboflavin kinase/FAD synthetase [Lachnospiraceae bacterium]|nr:bifunctional riboflavin kinase/FAD synthetase [Lachnospiraceae bacterium]